LCRRGAVGQGARFKWISTAEICLGQYLSGLRCCHMACKVPPAVKGSAPLDRASAVVVGLGVADHHGHRRMMQPQTWDAPAISAHT
jgi:hypothetical protein